MIINTITQNKTRQNNNKSTKFGCELRITSPIYKQIKKIAKSEGYSTAEILESFQSLKTFVKDWNANHEKIAKEAIGKALKKNHKYSKLKDIQAEEIVPGSITGKFNISSLKTYSPTQKNSLEEMSISGNIKGDSVIFLTKTSQKSKDKYHKQPKNMVEIIKTHVIENFNNFIEDSMNPDSFFKN